ncbi:MAG: UDP-glucose/GDP-mannose dehydrogenase family protein [Planctomycetes bacterium]|nr:UDP-glucose/GDP-mannose dehydrogenase family protein [Planctomycetota bacterium]MBI3835188.1 UDP-glucose/GDP-mannose dehydrogenase family protein [Planctomycetota bacterium]
MNLAVIGTGYVGLVAGACFADSGNRVICVDCDEAKIARLKKGEVPIYEPGLSEIVQRNQRNGRIVFTTELAAAVRQSRVVFIAVGTPQSADGSADLSGILASATTIAKSMDGYRVVVMKSTVPVGTHALVSKTLRENTDHPFDYVSNPEFLKEGAAIDDFTKPDRVVIGVSNLAAGEIMRELYAPFLRRDERIFVMDPASAELTKYAANAMLALRISFINEMAELCERFGGDVEHIRRGIGSDSRIGNAFLYPGVGYGGSCFPKDVSALVSMGNSVDFPMLLTAAAQEANLRQRRLFAQKIIAHFGTKAKGIALGVWGLAFKAKTDDVRESPAIAAIRMFLEHGIRVHVHDPEANATARSELGDSVKYFDDGYDALDGADALVIFTDWAKFKTPDFDMIASKLKHRVIFDGRNLYDPGSMARKGFQYVCIGRPTVPPDDAAPTR